MIKLHVEPYCHGCPNFEAYQEMTTVYSGCNLECMSDCLIYCKHEKVCRRINEYLIRKLDEEKNIQ